MQVDVMQVAYVNINGHMQLGNSTDTITFRITMKEEISPPQEQPWDIIICVTHPPVTVSCCLMLKLSITIIISQRVTNYRLQTVRLQNSFFLTLHFSATPFYS